MKYINLKVFTLILFIPIGLWLIKYGKEPSLNPEIFIWSWDRFKWLVLLLLICGYLSYSLFSPLATKINAYCLYVLFIMGLGIEITIRLKHSIIPSELIGYLPKKARLKVAKERGSFTSDSVIGEGMLFSRMPHSHPFPHEYIDENGYRNLHTVSNNVDIVILGDSMTMADQAEKDIGELFWDHGYKSLNLAMGNYAPQHYRDAYKKYIVDKKIKHKFTLVFLFVGNDFNDAIKYENIYRQGGDWKNYLNSSPITGSEFLPLTLSMSRGIPDFIANKVRKPKFVVSLPYKTLKVSSTLLWEPPLITEHDLSWNYVKSALDEIIFLAKEDGSIPLIFMYPTPGVV